MITVEPGGEYAGEIYIKCSCGERFSSAAENDQDSLGELEQWIAAHREHK